MLMFREGDATKTSAQQQLVSAEAAAAIFDRCQIISFAYYCSVPTHAMTQKKNQANMLPSQHPQTNRTSSRESRASPSRPQADERGFCGALSPCFDLRKHPLSMQHVLGRACTNTQTAPSNSPPPQPNLKMLSKTFEGLQQG